MAWSSSVKSLGVTLDLKLSFGQHVNNVCKANHCSIRTLHHICAWWGCKNCCLQSCFFQTGVLELVTSRYAFQFCQTSSCTELTGTSCSSMWQVWLYYTGFDWTALGVGQRQACCVGFQYQICRQLLYMHKLILNYEPIHFLHSSCKCLLWPMQLMASGILRLLSGTICPTICITAMITTF